MCRLKYTVKTAKSLCEMVIEECALVLWHLKFQRHCHCCKKNVRKNPTIGEDSMGTCGSQTLLSLKARA